MSSISNITLLKEQLNSKRNIILLYVFLGIVVWALAIIINGDIYPPSAVFAGVIALAVLFYVLLGNFILNPQLSSLNNLRIVFYVFIIGWVFAVSYDILYWGALYYTSFLGAIIAIAGIILIYQVLTQCLSMIKLPVTASGIGGTSIVAPSPTQVSSTRPQFCPSCGTSLANVSASNFCPNCGQKI